MRFAKFFLILSIFVSLESNSVELYKYQDESGKWVFTDKKPVTKQDAEKVEYEGNKKEAPKPRAFTTKYLDKHLIVFRNPYHAPVQLKVISSIFPSGELNLMIEGNSNLKVFESYNELPEFRYVWQLGDPGAQEDNYRYQFPVSSKRDFRISQSFNGRFSHSKQPNIYAVDIAMDVGTYVSAARGGTVIWVKDDYHTGGKDRYFLDKANYVRILHDDGTIGVYAHLLEGTALVKPGDKVTVGQRLARSGSSGFSTGPHLHFVIRKNVGLKTVSIPFQFVDQNGVSFSPRRGYVVPGNLKDR